MAARFGARERTEAMGNKVPGRAKRKGRLRADGRPKCPVLKVINERSRPLFASPL